MVLKNLTKVIDDMAERTRKRFEKIVADTKLKEGLEGIKTALGNFREDYLSSFEKLTGIELGKRELYLSEFNNFLKFFDLNPPFPEVDQVGDNLRIMIDVPGFTKEELELNCSSNKIRISGKVLFNDKIREIHKVINLPKTIDPNHADAELRNGVLTVRVPMIPE